MDGAGEHGEHFCCVAAAAEDDEEVSWILWVAAEAAKGLGARGMEDVVEAKQGEEGGCESEGEEGEEEGGGHWIGGGARRRDEVKCVLSHCW